ncbi:MAG: hypothetical protein QOF76_4374, partial [Solirubrobacteraceae bacterium]|nr:hypothetical protein [Solirubrobacteraceae bacterium]
MDPVEASSQWHTAAAKWHTEQLSIC